MAASSLIQTKNSICLSFLTKQNRFLLKYTVLYSDDREDYLEINGIGASFAVL